MKIELKNDQLEDIRKYYTILPEEGDVIYPSMKVRSDVLKLLRYIHILQVEIQHHNMKVEQLVEIAANLGNEFEWSDATRSFGIQDEQVLSKF